MRKYVLLLTVFAFSFADAQELPIPQQTEVRFPVYATTWCEWRIEPCYEGISYRVKMLPATGTDNTDEYYLQIENRYYEPINITIAIREMGNNLAYDRVTIKPQKTATDNWYYVPKGSKVHIIIKDFRFGLNDTGTYYKCDNPLEFGPARKAPNWGSSRGASRG